MTWWARSGIRTNKIKPYHIETRWIANKPRLRFSPNEHWHVYRRYKTEKARNNALEAFEKYERTKESLVFFGRKQKRSWEFRKGGKLNG